MEKLHVPIHPNFDAIMQYGGRAQRVVFAWVWGAYARPELLYDDGTMTGVGNTFAWMIWAAHPMVKKQIDAIRGSQSWAFFCFDRKSRTLELTCDGLETDNWLRANSEYVTAQESLYSLADFGQWVLSQQEPDSVEIQAVA